MAKFFSQNGYNKIDDGSTTTFKRPGSPKVIVDKDGKMLMITVESNKSLKTEGNEDLSSFNLKDLNVKQLDAAMENAGYTDNGIRKARFSRIHNQQGTINFVYTIQFVEQGGEAGEGTVYISVNKDGYIVGEPG